MSSDEEIMVDVDELMVNVGPVRMVIGSAARAHLTLSTIMREKHPSLPGIEALLAQTADLNEDDDDEICRFNNRLRYAEPNQAEDDDGAGITHPVGTQLEQFIRDWFLQEPTPANAFRIAAEVEARVDDFLDWVKRRMTRFGDHDGFQFIDKIQGRAKKRMNRMDRFATRTDTSNNSTLIIVDVMLEELLD